MRLSCKRKAGSMKHDQIGHSTQETGLCACEGKRWGLCDEIARERVVQSVLVPSLALKHAGRSKSFRNNEIRGSAGAGSTSSGLHHLAHPHSNPLMLLIPWQSHHSCGVSLPVGQRTTKGRRLGQEKNDTSFSSARTEAAN